MFKNGLGDLMKKAQSMQENMQKMQEELANKKVIGQAGAGVVQVTLNGQYACEKVELSAEALQEDKEMLEALIAAAISDANKKVQELTKQEMSALTGGFNIPGFKFPL